jgi:protein-L-isoaspartate(D-aspartate) O-methyltransferase
VGLIHIILSLIMGSSLLPQVDKFVAERADMVRSQISDRGITHSATLKAMKKVPRHLFIPKENEKYAYGDYPLPIGYNQTISQPYIVAFMTESVKPSEKKRVLEIGTGSGYQAAVLAEIVDTVYTIEIVPELARESAEKFKKMGYNNIISKAGDGYIGWKEHAPFDIIIITAAAESIPEPLLEQLAENGRLVIPVGKANSVQELILAVKKNGKIETKHLMMVRFVPFKRS